MNENTQIAVGVLAVVIIGGLVYSFKDKLMGTGTDPNNGTNNGGNTSGGNTSGGNTSGGNTSGGNTSGGNTSGGNTSGGNTSGGNTSGGTTNTVFPLQKGSKGTNVVALQNVLNSKFNAKLNPDGAFGSKTEAALKAATGNISITESQFNTLKAGVYVNPNLTPTATEGQTSVSSDTLILLSAQLWEDIDEDWGTRDDGLWKTVNNLTNAKLVDLAKTYGKSYGSSEYALYSDMSQENFGLTVDFKRVKERLKELNLAFKK